MIASMTEPLDELRVIILFCPSVAVIILPFFSLIFSGVGLNGSFPVLQERYLLL
jgi:hypothetical protein